MNLEPFRAEHIEAAAELLAKRHRRDFAASRGLPERFTETAHASAAIEACWQLPSASGAVAFQGDEMVGYLVADLSLGGPVCSAWMRLPGHAIAPSADPDLYRDLYAAAASTWVDQGCFEHHLTLPAHDESAREAMCRLGFGYWQAYALRGLGNVPAVDRKVGSDIAIRRAGPADAQILAGLSPLIIQSAVRSPSFTPIPPDDLPKYAEGFADLAGREDWTIFLAEHDGEVLGYAAFSETTVEAADDLMTPARCIELNIAATRPEARGLGIGTALTLHGLQWAQEEGYASCLIDWHVPSLLASRFWPRFGFEPVAYRLARRIDPRRSWADAGIG